MKLTDKVYTREKVEKQKDEFTWSNVNHALVNKDGAEVRFPNFEDAMHFYENSTLISEKQTLAWYHTHALDHYQKPSVTVDLIGLRFVKKNLQIMLIKRKSHVEGGKWAFPGGFVEPSELITDACLRETKEETNVTLHKSQLIRMLPVDTPNRDPRMPWLITNPSIVLFTPENVRKMEKTAHAGDDAADLNWFNIRLDENDHLVLDRRAGKLAFDHRQILTNALIKLKRDFNLQGMPEITKLLGKYVTTRSMLNLYSLIDTKFESYTSSNLTTLYRKYLVRTDEVSRGKKRKGNNLIIYEWKKRDYKY